MKKSAVIAYIRQLCSLGLGGQIIMPELMNALHELISSRTNCFLYADENGRIANIFMESFNLADEIFPPPNSCIHSKIDHSAYLRSMGMRQESISTTMDSAVWQAFNPGFLLNTPIRDPEAGLLGTLQLLRCHNESPFTLQDQNLINSLIPCLVLGIKSKRDTRTPIVNSGVEGLIIATQAAKMLYISPSGQELMHLATNPMILSISLDSPQYKTDLPAAIAKLCKNLVANFTEKSVLPTIHIQQNNWGKFVFRSHWLVTVDQEQSNLIGITVERHIPQPLKLVKAMCRQSLTPRQKEICLLISYGYSNTEIAERLQISQHTASDFIKQIYIRLEVHSRNQLLEKLKSLDGIDFSHERKRIEKATCTNSQCPHFQA